MGEVRWRAPHALEGEPEQVLRVPVHEAAAGLARAGLRGARQRGDAHIDHANRKALGDAIHLGPETGAESLAGEPDLDEGLFFRRQVG